jgi:hypothetical protein
MLKSIRRWYQQFGETGCVCKGQSTGRPCISEENFSRDKQLLGHCVSKCCGNGSFHKLMQIPMSSFFSKMGHQQVRDFLNASLPQHWIGRMGPQDLALCTNFAPKISRHYNLRLFLVKVRQRLCFCVTLATNLVDLRNRITAVVIQWKKTLWETYGMNSAIVLMLFVQQVEGT